MNDLVPSGEKVSREALERIIRRAAELQASEREIGDSLTEEQVLELGRDVGLPARYIQQALLEERTRVAPVHGVLGRLMGPIRVATSRTVPGDRADVEAALGHWMTEEELLTVKRRYRQVTSWEARKDFIAGVRRAFGIGGRTYVLSGAKEIAGEVTQLEPGYCHVSLAADLSNTRDDHAIGAGLLATAGGVTSAIAFALGFMTLVAVVPAVAGLGLSTVVFAGRKRGIERVQVALEQVLDRLEHGEIRPNRLESASRGLLSRAIRDEVRKHLGS